MKNGKCYECILVTMDTFHSQCYLEVQVVKEFTTTLLIPVAFFSLKREKRKGWAAPNLNSSNQTRLQVRSHCIFLTNKTTKIFEWKLAKNKVFRKYLLSKWIWTVDYQEYGTLYIVWKNNIWNLSYGEPAFKDVGLTLPLISFGRYRSKDKSHTSDS